MLLEINRPQTMGIALLMKELQGIFTLTEPKNRMAL